MEGSVTLSFTVPLTRARRILAIIEDETREVTQSNTGSQSSPSDARPAAAPLLFRPRTAPEDRLRSRLGEMLEKLARFIANTDGQFYNDELASALGVYDPRTSIYLGRMTRHLRKLGFTAEGFKGDNWYATRRAAGRTQLTVRRDVLALFKAAFPPKSSGEAAVSR